MAALGSGRVSCSTTFSVVGRATTKCGAGAMLLQLTADSPTRVRVQIGAEGNYAETIEFDVIGRVAFAVAASDVDISARSATGTSILSWLAVPVTAWSPSHLSYNVLLDAGTYDSSDSGSTLAVPVGASAVQVVPRTSGDSFDITLKDGPTTSAVYSRADQPSQPIPLGRASRVLLTCAGPVRVVYAIAV